MHYIVESLLADADVIRWAKSSPFSVKEYLK